MSNPNSQPPPHPNSSNPGGSGPPPAYYHRRPSGTSYASVLSGSPSAAAAAAAAAASSGSSADPHPRSSYSQNIPRHLTRAVDGSASSSSPTPGSSYPPQNVQAYPPSQHHRTRSAASSRAIMDPDGIAVGSASSSTNYLARLASSMAAARNISVFGDDIHGRTQPEFFIPSYLRTSRLAQRLEDAHRQKEQAGTGKNGSDSAGGAGSLSTSAASAGGAVGGGLHEMMVPSHRGMTHDIVERGVGGGVGGVVSGSTVGEEPPPLPSRWNEKDKFSGLELMNGGLDVKYTGMSKATDEAAAIRADHPMPKQCGIYYFEVTVLSKAKEGLISIGFSGPKVSLNRLPGWEPDSWAYHGDDGMTFCATQSGKTYGPKYATTDVIGCGVNFRTGEAFFTKNGHYLGPAFKNIKTDTNLFPSVGMKRPHEHLRVNFGQSPFIFDIDRVVKREMAHVRDEIRQTSVDNLHPNHSETDLIHRLVAQYLAHDGYIETARAFVNEVQHQHEALHGPGSTLSHDLQPGDDDDAMIRQRIRSSILAGDIDGAIAYTNEHYPSVFSDNRDIYFKLRCRKFIEMIKHCADLQPAASSTSVPPFSTATSNGKASSATVSFATNGRLEAPSSHHHPTSHDDYSDVFGHQMDLDEQLSGPVATANGTASNTVAGASSSASGAGLNSAARPASVDWMDTSDDFNRGGPPSSSSPSPSASGSASAAAAATTAGHTGMLDQALLQFGQELRREFANDQRRETQNVLNATFALIAYPDPRQGPLGYLLRERERGPISEELNGAILISQGKPSFAALERVIQQTEVLLEELAEDGGPGAFVNLRGEYLRRQ